MHIILTNPWQAGTIDDLATYPHAKIVGFAIEIAHRKQVIITIEFGEMTGGDWVKGKIGRYRILLANEDYNAFMQANLSVLQALQGALYETVQTRFPEKAAGTIG